MGIIFGTSLDLDRQQNTSDRRAHDLETFVTEQGNAFRMINGARMFLDVDLPREWSVESLYRCMARAQHGDTGNAYALASMVAVGQKFCVVTGAHNYAVVQIMPKPNVSGGAMLDFRWLATR